MAQTLEQIAAQFDGREYPFDPTKDEEKYLSAIGVVMVYGASDDLMEFRGAINDETGASDGSEAFISKGDLIEVHDDCECKFCGYKAMVAGARKITAHWCPSTGHSWTYTTDIPHATFEIMEDGDKYCRGIVFDLKALA